VRSLFDRLTRFGFNPSRDLSELRLTEAFAATLEAAPDVTRGLVAHIFGIDPPPGEVAVSSQRRTAEGDRVDVEIHFGPLVEPSLLAWLELKWKDTPRTEQLHRYDAALKALGGVYERRLALIAPDYAEVPSLPEGVAACSWDELGRKLVKGEGQPLADSYAAELTRQFVHYLEENNLTTTGAFSLTDALALSTYETARDRMETIVTLAEQELGVQAWPDLRQDTRSRDPLRFHRTCEFPAADLFGAVAPDISAPTPSGWQDHPDVRFELQGRNDYARGDRARKEWGFAAGIWCGTEDRFEGSVYSDWRSGLEPHGFEYVRGSHKREMFYLLRFLYPAELVPSGDLTEQATSLAEWVRETYSLLADNPPPRGAEV
jgi:hypothetical protein